MKFLIYYVNSRAIEISGRSTGRSTSNEMNSMSTRKFVITTHYIDKIKNKLFSIILYCLCALIWILWIWQFLWYLEVSCSCLIPLKYATSRFLFCTKLFLIKVSKLWWNIELKRHYWKNRVNFKSVIFWLLCSKLFKTIFNERIGCP